MAQRGLEVEHNADFQRREWLVQRVGWAVIALVLAAAMAGLTGSGPASKGAVSSSDGTIRLDYERIVRHESATHLRFRVNGAPLRSGAVEFWLDREYAAGLHIESITPEPELTATDAARLYYRFRVPPNADAAQIELRVQPGRVGSRDGQAGVTNGASLAFSQFVFP